MKRIRDATATAVAAVLLVGIAGCSTADDDNDSAEEAGAPAVPSVVVPAERLSVFCETMIGLGDQLVTDPPADEGALILDTYLAILDEVPEEIEPDFRAVIATLQADDPPPTTTDPDPTAVSTVPGERTEDFDAEGRLLPGESPSERVNEYVVFTCRDSANNPGPPATEPLEDVVPGEDDEPAE